jgi:hypothetical protein
VRFQTRNNLLKDRIDHLLANSHNILNWCKFYICTFFNVRNCSDVRQKEIHTIELLIPDPTQLEAEIAIAELIKFKSTGSGQIPAEMIQTGGKILVSVIH